MDTKILKTGPWKRASVAAAGFGFGGMLWGLEAYRGTVGAGESFTNPFSYILGAVALAVFGGHALAYATKAEGVSFGWQTCFGYLSGTRTIKIIGLGIIGWLAAFAVPAAWVEWWSIWSVGILSVVLGFLSSSEALMEVIPRYLRLEPNLHVATLFLEFLFTGAIVGFAYSLIFKAKILRTVLWSAGGFALASLVGPILGNLVGNLFNSLIVSYILIFGFLCAITGVYIYRGIDGSLKKAPGDM